MALFKSHEEGFLASMRHHRWLHWLFVAVGVFLIILVFYVMFSAKPKQQEAIALRQRLADIEVYKDDKVSVLNVLNSFHLSERERSSGQSAEPIVETLRETQDKLNNLNLNPEMRKVTDDINGFLTAWEQKLEAREDPSALLRSSLSLSKQYPWLDTILLLIVLNAL